MHRDIVVKGSGVKHLKLMRAAIIAVSLGFLWASHCPFAAAQAQPGFGLYSSALRQNLSRLSARRFTLRATARLHGRYAHF